MAAAAFAAEVKELRRRHPRKFDPSSSALLILDMQEYFLRPESHAFVPGAPLILPGLKKLQDRFLEAGRPVVQTRHLNRPGRAGTMEKWWHGLIREDDPLSSVSPVLADPRVTVLIKSRYDAFHRTRLETWLKKRDVRSLVIAGVVTHLCVETTVRSAFVRDFECFLTLDGTATWDDAFFRGSVRNLSHGFATPLRIAEILRTFPS
jgi:isochorismate hydrolase